MEFNGQNAAIKDGVLQKQIFRSSYRRCSLKTGVLTNFAKLQETPVPDLSSRPQP